MSVEWSKRDTSDAYVGKSKLTKQINDDGFGITTSLAATQVWDAMKKTCLGYPRKEHKFPKGQSGPVAQNIKGTDVVAYGPIGVHKNTGQDVVGIPDWALVLTKGSGSYAYVLRLARAKVQNGKIWSVEEMGYWVNELEGNLRVADAEASIEMAVS